MKRWLTAVCAAAVVLLPVDSFPENIRLHSGNLTAFVSPETLAVNLETSAGTAQISAAQSGLGTVKIINRSTTSAAWIFPDRDLHFDVSLNNATFHLSARTSSPQKIKWPVADPQSSSAEFILPFWMGSRVPVADQDWQQHLLHNSPMRMIEGFSIPAAGLLSADRSITWRFDDPFHNQVQFTTGTAGLLSMAVEHAFTTAALTTGPYRVAAIVGPRDPIAPAKVYREYLKKSGQWLPLTAKAAKIPGIKKLAGAAQIYFWAGETLDMADVHDWKGLAADLKSATNDAHAPLAVFFEKASADEKSALTALATEQWPGAYAKRAFVEEANHLVRQWGGQIVSSGTEAEMLQAGSERLYKMLSGRLKPVRQWGGAFSVGSMDKLRAAGIDRLWIGLDTWRTALGHVEAVREAEKNGYLVGPYDSYHSMHSPKEKNTWETAQFGQKLYETGAVIGADGKPMAGFKQKGYLLSPLAARPYVEKRISGLMKQVPFNSWFFDCDAFGQYYDSYSKTFPQTEQSDLAARISRMQWAGKTFGLVVGSEGGVAYAASGIAFAEGLMTPCIEWGDKDMYHDKKSPYYLGRYWPPEAPEVAFKQVKLKPEYEKFYFNPAFRVPLYSIALGDSVVVTHEWGFPSKKFSNEWQTVRLTELLYGVPPLEHVNGETFSKWLKGFLPYQHVFTRLHRAIMLTGMTDFQTLTPDRMVQKSTFGSAASVTVNFGDHAWKSLPTRTARIEYFHGTNPPEIVDYSPAHEQPKK